MTDTHITETLAFRKTVVVGLNALTQNFLIQREQFIIVAAEEAGLDLNEWMPNYDTGMFVWKIPPRNKEAELAAYMAAANEQRAKMHLTPEGIEP